MASELLKAVPKLTTIHFEITNATDPDTLQDMLTAAKKLSDLGNLEISSPSGKEYKRELPSALWELTQLQKLTLSNLDIPALSDDIVFLTELTALSLNFLFYVRNLPDNIATLNNLQQLELNGLALAEVPESIYSLNHLQQLTLKKLSIEEIPDEISQLTQLRELHLASLNITTLLAKLGKLTHLQKLVLESIPTLTSQETIELANNPQWELIIIDDSSEEGSNSFEFELGEP